MSVLLKKMKKSVVVDTKAIVILDRKIYDCNSSMFVHSVMVSDSGHKFLKNCEV